jgi:membrane-associated phospholipid phosphatase
MLAFSDIRHGRRAVSWSMLFLIALFGALIEIAQGLFTSFRYADPFDFIANVTGITAAYFLLRSAETVRIRYFSLPALACFVAFHLYPNTLYATENIFTSSAEIGNALQRLADEGREVAAVPFDTSGYGLLGTLLTGGAVALTTLFDEDINTRLSRNRSSWLDHAADAGSLIGDPILHLGIAGLIYGGGVLADSTKYREFGEMAGEALILADAAALILKESIGRSRPSLGNGSGSYRPFQFRNDYDSLPSMHTASAVALASVTASTSESLLVAIAAYSAAAFVGLSRIYQEKHWTSDVLLGAVIGELCGRVVTGYHATARTSQRITVVPQISESTGLISLVGRF